MDRRHFVSWALAAGLSISTGMADEVPEQLRRCAEIEDDARRLACYDRHVRGGAAETTAAAPSAAAPVSGSPAPGSSEPPPAADAEQGFGLPEEREQREEEPDLISARITRIDVRRNGERIFTLDNGQMWVEDSPAPSLRLEVGDTVTIKAGLFGSHRLFGSGHRSSGVDRVR